MKKIVVLVTAAALAAVLCSCGKKAADPVPEVHKSPVVQTQVPTESKNPISDPIIKGNIESALSDARSCLNVLVMSQVEEGIGSLDDGIVFVVTKGNAEYYFVYSDGDLEQTDEQVHGVEITPEYDGWLENVRAYMP